MTSLPNRLSTWRSSTASAIGCTACLPTRPSGSGQASGARGWRRRCRPRHQSGRRRSTRAQAATAWSSRPTARRPTSQRRKRRDAASTATRDGVATGSTALRTRGSRLCHRATASVTCAGGSPCRGAPRWCRRRETHPRRLALPRALHLAPRQIGRRSCRPRHRRFRHRRRAHRLFRRPYRLQAPPSLLGHHCHLNRASRRARRCSRRCRRSFFGRTATPPRLPRPPLNS